MNACACTRLVLGTWSNLVSSPELKDLGTLILVISLSDYLCVTHGVCAGFVTAWKHMHLLQSSCTMPPHPESVATSLGHRSSHLSSREHRAEIASCSSEDLDPKTNCGSESALEQAYNIGDALWYTG